MLRQLQRNMSAIPEQDYDVPVTPRAVNLNRRSIRVSMHEKGGVGVAQDEEAIYSELEG